MEPSMVFKRKTLTQKSIKLSRQLIQPLIARYPVKPQPLLMAEPQIQKQTPLLFLQRHKVIGRTLT